MIDENYVEVISNIQLSEANRLWDTWLKEHGLKLSDFGNGDVLQEVGRAKVGSFSTSGISAVSCKNA